MIPKPFFTQDDKSLLQIGWWLLIVGALVFVMILVGGATRLTQSGLSIVEWKPISGTIPPLSEEAWLEEFAAYQAYPEYQQLNQDMTVEEFKGIFWWEFWHRNLGRLIGLAFALPLLFFMGKHRIPPDLKPRMFILLTLGAAQGLLGWYMVQSGLVDRPSVSHLRLTAHLFMAVLLLSALVWTAWQVLKAPVARGQGTKERAERLGGYMVAFTGLVAVQLALGAMTAGLDAGMIYNQWPNMGAGLIPADLFGTSPFYNDPTTVQFFHRITAYLIVAMAFILFLDIRRNGGLACVRTLSVGLIYLVVLQAALGILTLLMTVPVILGLMHQGLGIVLFIYCLYFIFALRGQHYAQDTENPLRHL